MYARKLTCARLQVTEQHFSFFVFHLVLADLQFLSRPLAAPAATSHSTLSSHSSTQAAAPAPPTGPASVAAAELGLAASSRLASSPAAKLLQAPAPAQPPALTVAPASSASTAPPAHSALAHAATAGSGIVGAASTRDVVRDGLQAPVDELRFQLQPMPTLRVNSINEVECTACRGVRGCNSLFKRAQDPKHVTVFITSLRQHCESQSHKRNVDQRKGQSTISFPRTDRYADPANVPVSCAGFTRTVIKYSSSSHGDLSLDPALLMDSLTPAVDDSHQQREIWYPDRRGGASSEAVCFRSR